MKNVDFRLYRPKKGHILVSRKVNYHFLNTNVSYEERLEQNCGAKKFDLSFTVFKLFTIEVFSFFLYVSINYLQNIASTCKKFNFDSDFNHRECIKMQYLTTTVLKKKKLYRCTVTSRPRKARPGYRGMTTRFFIRITTY